MIYIAKIRISQKFFSKKLRENLVIGKIAVHLQRDSDAHYYITT